MTSCTYDKHRECTHSTKSGKTPHFMLVCECCIRYEEWKILDRIEKHLCEIVNELRIRR